MRAIRQRYCFVLRSLLSMQFSQVSALWKVMKAQLDKMLNLQLFQSDQLSFRCWLRCPAGIPFYVGHILDLLVRLTLGGFIAILAIFKTG